MPKIRPQTASQRAAIVVEEMRKEKAKEGRLPTRRDRDLADDWALKEGVNRAYIFEAAKLADYEPALFQKLLDSQITIPQALRAVSLKQSNRSKYARILKCTSPKEAKKILGRKAIDPVLEIKKLWRGCDGRQRRIVRNWIGKQAGPKSS
jgi:hypothetical protein